MTSQFGAAAFATTSGDAAANSEATDPKRAEIAVAPVPVSPDPADLVGSPVGNSVASDDSGPAIRDPRLPANAPVEHQASAGAGASNLTVDDVKIEGNRLVSADDIMSVVKTKPGDRFDRDVVMQDLKAINNMGYFDDRQLQVVPELTGAGVLLKIRVQENAPITQFSFEGNNVLSTDEIQKTFADQLGKPQNLGSLSAAIDKIEQAYHEKGYVLARVTDVKDDPDGSVGLKITEGQIDKIVIAGNTKTKDFIIRRGIKLKPGTVYNEKALTADLRKLYANGYFQDVRRSLSPSPDNPDHYVLKVEVDEKRSGSVGLGGGVDTVAGPFGSFTISDNNFQGRGQLLSLNTQMSTGLVSGLNNTLANGNTAFLANLPTYQAQLSWVEPNLGGTNASLSATTYGRDLQSMMIQQAMQKTFGAGVTLSKPLGRHIVLSLGLSADKTWFQDVSSYYQSQSIMATMMENGFANHYATNSAQAYALAQGVRSAQLQGGAYLSVNPTISYDTRDSKIDPTKGTLLRLTGTPNLGLSGAFLKAGASASQFIPINESTTLATNVQGGTSVGAVPQYGMYRLGGFSGIPGYRQFTDLGTGTGMLMATAEMRSRLPFLANSDSKFLKMIDKHVKGTMFLTGGQLYGNNYTNTLLGRTQTAAAVGVGVRISLPMVGVVRISYGLPLINTALGSTKVPRLNIGFGDNF
ncbi:unnamed protein product [Sphagnum balticum]